MEPGELHWTRALKTQDPDLYKLNLRFLEVADSDFWYSVPQPSVAALGSAVRFLGNNVHLEPGLRSNCKPA